MRRYTTAVFCAFGQTLTLNACLLCSSLYRLLTTLKNMLPEVGDLQRSSDVAEPSLMSHRPAAEMRQVRMEKLKIITTMNKQIETKSRGVASFMLYTFEFILMLLISLLFKYRLN